MGCGFGVARSLPAACNTHASAVAYEDADALLSDTICLFYFAPRRVFFNHDVLPTFQELEGQGLLKMENVTLKDFTQNGSLAKTHTIVSHKWMSKCHPDPDGLQLRIIRKHLSLHPDISWIWIDYCSIPQGDRTPEQTMYFRQALNYSNFLYLFLPVLIVADEDYLVRFWCLLELFLSFMTFKDGAIRPRPNAMSAFIEWTSGDTEENRACVRTWADLSVESAFEKLVEDRIMVTSQSDKFLQISRLKFLEKNIQLLFEFEALKRQWDSRRGEERDYAGLLKQLGDVQSALGRVRESSMLWQLAERVYIQVGSTKSVDYATLLRSIGTVFSDQGRFEEAMDRYQKAEQGYLAAGAAASENYADLLRRMGVVCFKHGRLMEAMVWHKKAEQGYLAAGATASTSYAELLTNMGAVCRKQGRLEEAMVWFQKAEQGYLAAGATASTSYANLLVNMGVVCRKQGRLEEAMDWYEKSEQGYLAAGATASTDYAVLLVNMGALCRSRGRPEEAMDWFQKAEQGFLAAGATASTSYANLLRNMGTVCSDQGRLEEAMDWFQKAEKGYLAAGAAASVDYANLLRNIGAVCGKRGALEEAMDWLQKAEQGFLAAGATASTDYADLLVNMGEVCGGQGRLEEAMGWYEKADQGFLSAGAADSQPAVIGRSSSEALRARMDRRSQSSDLPRTVVPVLEDDPA